MRIHRVPKWVWWCLAAVVALHIYFFQELVAAELLFAVVFGSLLLLLMAIYAVSEAGDRGLGWVETGYKSFGVVARRQWERVEAVSKRTFHRPHSESAR